MGGVWEAKKIANPEYVDDDALYSYADFGFIGFDLWQVKGGTIFDNVIVTDDVAEADEFAKNGRISARLRRPRRLKRMLPKSQMTRRRRTRMRTMIKRRRQMLRR